MRSHPMSIILTSIADTLRTEAAAVARLADEVPAQGTALTAVCELIRSACGEGLPGRLVVTGVGKAGIIARKLAATFSSTGTPALFLHPAEARHGDLGMVAAADVVLALSNSGSSEEVVALLPSLKLIGCPLVALVGRTDSPLARHATHVLSIGRVVEACPLGLAPSTSTTALLALGDALALAVLRLRQLTPQQYARFHPGGALGRKLMTCAEAMRSGERVPAVAPDTTVLACMRAITAARAGSVVLVDGGRRLLGIFTDGDLRRTLTRSADPAKVLAEPVRQHATCPCRSMRGSELLQAALHLCAEKHFNELPVVDDDGLLIGLLDLQDLVDRGFEVG
jgi:arabinose-5-phosphate isomerase